MHRKNYVALAEALKQVRRDNAKDADTSGIIDCIEAALIIECTRDNPNFNPPKFRAAALPKE